MQHGSKYYARRPPHRPWGSKLNDFGTWSCVYHIKGKHECSNMVANILPAEPSSPPSPDPGVKRSKFNFSRTWSDCIPNEIESRMRKRGSIYFARKPLLPPPDPGGGVKMSKLTFSKYGHVAYQLKWNHKCSHMVTNIFPADPPGPWGSKG